MTVDEISTAIGLNDANYLARRFRKIEGMSPGEYRKNGNEKTVCANSQRGRFFV
ncbi:MAG: helix-turn-helix domain-containing protein [Fusicatenibacter saccharivorans]